MKPKKTVAPSKPKAKPAKARKAVAIKAKAPAKAKAKEAKPAKKKPAPTVKKTAPAKSAPTVKKAVPANALRVLKKKSPKIPAFLLEGDKPSPAPAASGPGQRFALGPKPPVHHFSPTEGELPDSYGTQQLFLTARDPHWLYAHWDMSGAQLKKHNALSSDGHLVLRVLRDEIGGEVISQIHLHPESRNWFVPVPEAGTKYAAQLGYYDVAGKWIALSSSSPTLTPPDSMSDDSDFRFATIPADVPFEQLLKLVKLALRENVPLAEALQQLRAEGFTNLPEASQIWAGEWTPTQEKALASVVSMDQVRRVWIGSLEVTELIRRQLQEDVSSISASQFGLPSSFSVSSLSSPFGGGGEKRRGFWFNVNAELIIYGATEPDAAVTIGGRPIKLRPDGSFSFRFALPDGDYALPAVALSADGQDMRKAALKFSRDTQYSGEVGAHPQDPKLQPPIVAAVG